MRKSVATATTALMVAGLAVGAIAIGGHVRGNPADAVRAAWSAIAQTSIAHAATQPQPQTSLAQVIRVAEQRTGGRARKVEMENDRGIEVYEIKTVSKNKSATVFVDMATGSVVRVHTPGYLFDRDDQREDQADFARLEVSSLTLAAAIETAEKETGGRAVEAAMKNMYGSTLFEVHVVKDWVKQKVLVDPATAKVVTIRPDREHNDD